jgi:hypothetical protein
VAESPRPLRPSVQGIYDALRGGHRNLDADWEAATALEREFPGTAAQMLEEQSFTMRAVAWAAERGVRQFIVNAGMPAPAGRNPHEAARAVRPDAVTVYACGDPYAAAWSRALLAEGDPLVAAVEAHARIPGDILGNPVVGKLIDFAEPVCLALPMLLHFVPPSVATLMLSGITWPLTTGSAVVVSTWADGGRDRAARLEAVFGRQVWPHAPAAVAQWMKSAGLRIVPGPGGSGTGVVEARLWPRLVWADEDLADRPAGRIIVAVGVRE